MITFVLFHALICSTFSLSLVEAKTDGFSIDLIHRDSPQSPSYDAQLDPWERVENSLRRSSIRANHLASLIVGPEAKTFSSGGEFLMKLSIGTPPLEIVGVADTGSDIIWTQCQPCKNCYKQKDPLFAPQNSSTYKRVLSNTNLCRAFRGKPWGQNKTICAYEVRYEDYSHSRGIASTEKFTMWSTSGQPISLPHNIAFGCGYDNVGVYNYDGSGVIGLGGTSTSLINQMSSLTGGKFSYCIAPKTKSSKMHFGAKAIVSGVGVVSAKMQISKNGFYKLKLKGLSVGNKRFSVSSKFLCSSTDIVIDSGAVVTYLPQKLYASLEASMEKEIGRIRIADPRGNHGLCYKISDKISPPIVTIHFSHADVKLEMRNTFIQVRDNIICLAFSPEYEPIFGSKAQENFLVGYDLRKKTIYFKPTDCTKQ